MRLHQTKASGEVGVGEFSAHARKSVSSTVANALRFASGIIILALLAFAPLHYGSTRSGGIELLWAISGFAAVCWCISLALERRIPPFPPIIWLFGGLVALAALIWTTHGLVPTPVASFTQSHLAQITARWPVCITWWNQENQLGLIAALALIILVVGDLARSGAWRMALASVLVMTGVGVAAIAFAQNLSHGKTIYWETGPPLMTNFSGTFYHHTTAGAYLNTVWPIALALVWKGWSVGVAATFASLATVVLLAAHAAHVSRMPQVIAVSALPIILIWLTRNQGAFPSELSARTKLLMGGGATLSLLLFAVLIATTGKLDQIAGRWHALTAPPVSVGSTAAPNPPESSWPALMRADLVVPTNHRGGLLGTRGIAYQSACVAIVARPWFGHGPANWIGAASEHCDDPFVRSFFQFIQFTHQDLLQFAVEWGLLGAIGWWGLLAGGPLWVVLNRRANTPLDPITIGVALALAALLLQAQWDFPLQIASVTLNAAVLAGICWAPRPTANAR